MMPIPTMDLTHPGTCAFSSLCIHFFVIADYLRTFVNGIIRKSNIITILAVSEELESEHRAMIIVSRPRSDVDEFSVFSGLKLTRDLGHDSIRV